MIGCACVCEQIEILGKDQKKQGDYKELMSPTIVHTRTYTHTHTFSHVDPSKRLLLAYLRDDIIMMNVVNSFCHLVYRCPGSSTPI